MSVSVTFQLPNNINSTDGENTVQIDVAQETTMRELSTNENLTKELPEGHTIEFEFNGKVVQPSDTLKSIGYFEIMESEPKPINVIYKLIQDFQSGEVHAYFFVYNNKRKQVVVSKNVEFNKLLNYIKTIFGIDENVEITLGTTNLPIQNMDEMFNVLPTTDIQVISPIKGGRRRHRSSATTKKRDSARRGRGRGRGRGSASKKRTTRRNHRNRNRYV